MKKWFGIAAGWRWLALVLVVPACSGGSEASGADGGGSALAGDGGAVSDGDAAEIIWPVLPDTSVSKQSALSETELTALGSGECLGQARDAITQAGYGSFAAAGQTEGLGNQVIWVTHAASNGSEGSAVEVCGEEGCRCFTGVWGAEGLTIEALDGGDNTLPVVGAPVLAKTLFGGELDGDTELAEMSGGLIEQQIGLLSPESFKENRRLIVANAYGPAFGVDFDPLLEIATASGRFTSVQHYPYIMAEQMDGILLNSHSLDVLIWVGAAVRAPKTGGKMKPEGMVVNRGLYGDQTYDRERIEAQLQIAPLGGPGLMILIGAEAFGTAADGLDAFGSAEHLVKSATARPRTLLGLRGLTDAQHALAALRAALEALLGDKSLADAQALANEVLLGAQTPVTLETVLDADEAADYSLAPALDAFWAGQSPSAGEFVGYVLIGGATQCTPMGGGQANNPIEKSVMFFTDVTFDGPFFAGERHDEDGNDFSVFGVIGGLRPGADIRFWIAGSAGDVTDITVLGDGRFCSPNTCGGTVTSPNDFYSGVNLYFAGGADATKYTSSAGETCLPSGLSLNQKGGQPSYIRVTQ